MIGLIIISIALIALFYSWRSLINLRSQIRSELRKMLETDSGLFTKEYSSGGKSFLEIQLENESRIKLIMRYLQIDRHTETIDEMRPFPPKKLNTPVEKI